MPDISVIIPCYNVGDYIERCLKSLLAQTVGTDKMEIICVDDLSTDGTLSILERYRDEYPDLIRVIHLSENGRQGRARNIALNEATGTWIAYVDSDDWVEPDYLKHMYDISTRTEEDVQIVTCGYDRDDGRAGLSFAERGISDDNGWEYKHIRVDSVSDRISFVRNRVLDYAVYSKLIRRSFLIENEITFPEGLAYEDIYWGGLLNMYASDVCLTDRKLYHYFINPNATILSAGGGYHYDMLTVQEQLWNEYIRRGLIDDYREEIELEFVYSCALAFWKIIALRFETPPYSMYQLLCVFTQTHIPFIWENRYIKEGALNEFYTLILQSLFSPLTKEEFGVFARQIKEIGI